ncbi:MAG: phosphotransferase [Proteobacteria bacterium]|nr:phosphotransferase [Pseudomonadota bacterium]
MNRGQACERPGLEAVDFVQRRWPAAGRAPDGPTWERMSGDGSDRVFWRVGADRESAVLVRGPDRAENRAYERIGRHLWRRDLQTPEFYAVDQSAGLFLIEDLGRTALFDVAGSADRVELERTYREVVRLLAAFHRRGLDGFDPEWCYQTRNYDRALIIERETGYFISAFVEGWLGMSRPDPGLDEEFGRLAEAALSGMETVLMHRDFQSRNVMIRNGHPRLVDFQGARLGPPGYDLASLIYDPYVGLGSDLRGELIERYVEERAPDGLLDRRTFERSLPALAACRLMQALGAYGHLGRVKGKPFFTQHIPSAVAGLEGLFASGSLDFLPGLGRLVRSIARRIEGAL